MSKTKRQKRTEQREAAKKRSLWHAREMMLQAVREQDIAWTFADTMSQFGKEKAK